MLWALQTHSYPNCKIESGIFEFESNAFVFIRHELFQQSKSFQLTIGGGGDVPNCELGENGPTFPAPSFARTRHRNVRLHPLGFATNPEMF
jgi:hypothetical protein